MERRSCRQYLKTAVDRSVVMELLFAAQKAPVSCNLQITQYVVIDDAEILKRLSKEVGYKFSFAPCYILVLSDKRFTVERQSAVMGAGMAVENMLLKATDLGLGTCAMAGFTHDDAIRKILRIPTYVDILLLVSVGYPDDPSLKHPIEKLKIEEIYSFNGYGHLKTIHPSPQKTDVQSTIDYRRRIAPVYLSRFRLNIFKEAYYALAFDFFKKNVIEKMESTKTINYLDVISYDGIFLRKVKEDMRNLNITGSDYLKNNLLFLKTELDIDTALINEKNEIQDVQQESIDVASFVFQIQFTPDRVSLMQDVSSKLKKGGLFFIGFIQESKIKFLIRKILNVYKKQILKKEVNIYENNPYYKIGMHWNVQGKDIQKLARISSLEEVVFSSHKDGKNTVHFFLFKKV
jgi:nitroreductase/ubiquinone/menaquinone biosynthesis C-methylase UbiE